MSYQLTQKAYTLQWLAQYNAIHMTFTAPFTAEDWLGATQLGCNLIHHRCQTAYFIYEYHIPVNYAPLNALNYLHQINDLKLQQNDLVQGLLQVGMPGLLKTIARVYIRTYGADKIAFFQDMAEAQAFLRSDRASA